MTLLIPIFILTLLIIFVYQFPVRKKILNELQKFVSVPEHNVHLAAGNGIALDYSNQKLHLANFKNTSSVDFAELDYSNGEPFRKGSLVVFGTKNNKHREVRLNFLSTRQAKKCLGDLSSLFFEKKIINALYENNAVEALLQLYRSPPTAGTQKLDPVTQKIQDLLARSGFSRKDAIADVRNQRLWDAVGTIFDHWEEIFGRTTLKKERSLVSRSLYDIFLRRPGEDESIGYTKNNLRVEVGDHLNVYFSQNRKKK